MVFVFHQVKFTRKCDNEKQFVIKNEIFFSQKQNQNSSIETLITKATTLIIKQCNVIPPVTNLLCVLYQKTN